MGMIVANLLGFDLTSSQVRTVLKYYNDLNAKFMLYKIIIAPNLSPSSLIPLVLFILVLG